MRVYTNRTVSSLWSYLKLGITLAVLFVLASQAVKFLEDEPAVQQLKQLIETAQPE